MARYNTRKQYYADYIAEFFFKRTFSFSKCIEAFFDVMAKYYPLSLIKKLIKKKQNMYIIQGG